MPLSALSSALQQMPLGGRIRMATDLPVIHPEAWGLDALRGRLVEVSAQGATAALTAVISLVVQAQAQGEPVAWVGRDMSGFYPPDVARAGVSLEALVIIRVPLAKQFRAAEQLLKSGAFGLVVLDFCGRGDLSLVQQGRLASTAQQNDAVVLGLCEKSDSDMSLGSMVSLRMSARRSCRAGVYEVSLVAIKDKRIGPGWRALQVVAALPGMSER
jgi:recombination protein RecA